MIGTHHSQHVHKDGPRTLSTTLGRCIDVGVKRGQRGARTFRKCFDENLHKGIFRQSCVVLSTQQNAVWNRWGATQSGKKTSGEHTEQGVWVASSLHSDQNE